MLLPSRQPKLLTTSRPPNGDKIPWQQGIPWQLAPLPMAVGLNGLLGGLEGPKLLQVAHALGDHGAFKHDQHAQREEGVVPAVQRFSSCACSR